MTKFLSNIRSDQVSVVFLVVILTSTFLF